MKKKRTKNEWGEKKGKENKGQGDKSAGTKKGCGQSENTQHNSDP